MGYKFAIDFGTTNTVVARWNEEENRPEVVSIPGMSLSDEDGRPPLVPSLLYVNDGKTGAVTQGQSVLDQKLNQQQNNRLFRNFKRGIVAAPAPEPREIDGTM